MAVYHRIYGNLMVLDEDEYKYLLSLDNNADHHEAIGNEALLEEFKKRSFIVTEDVDEYDEVLNSITYRQQHYQTGYLVRGLQLVVSNSCNFKCKYCFVDNMYNSKERTELQVSEENRQMSKEIAAKAMDELLGLMRKNGNKELYVEFFGGEPLMNWPVIEYVLETFQNGNKEDVEIVYSITTNGSLINEEMSKMFKKYNVTVTISFDSPKNTDRIPLSGKNAHHLIKDSIGILKNDGNWITFNSVLSKETIADFDGQSLVDFAIDNKVGMIGLILDLDLEFYQSADNRRKVVEKIISTYNYGMKRGLPIVGYWFQIFNQIVGGQYVNLDKGFKTCPAEGCKVSVEPAGHLFICKCCSAQIGHIDDLQAALHSAKYLEYAMKAYRNDVTCEGCDIENFCSGVCMGALEKRYGTISGKEKSSCKVFRELTRELIKTIKKN